jgi:TDG/mug DNA glycosylase family protein
MDAKTAQVYEDRAEEWIAARSAQPWALERIAALAGKLASGARVADLGCGPGWYAEALSAHGLRPVALDVSAAMLREGARRAPALPRVRGDLAALPFARESLQGALAVNCLMHLPADQLPVALAHLHASLAVGGRLEGTLPRLPADSAGARGQQERSLGDDRFPGRLFTAFDEARVRAALTGAGFEDIAVEPVGGDFWQWVSARRRRTLPDYVRPGLRVLICGLNPSLYSADSGVPYGRPGNRLWKAARAAGLCTHDRDPWAALSEGVGFSDLVKRATRAADELRPDEYSDGVRRLEDTVRFHGPGVVCFAGLSGWRQAVDRSAKPGWIDGGFGGRPAYLMPSPSGRNAHATAEDLAGHLARVAAAAPASGPPSG